MSPLFKSRRGHRRQNQIRENISSPIYSLRISRKNSKRKYDCHEKVFQKSVVWSPLYCIFRTLTDKCNTHNLSWKLDHNPDQTTATTKQYMLILINNNNNCPCKLKSRRMTLSDDIIKIIKCFIL